MIGLLREWCRRLVGTFRKTPGDAAMEEELVGLPGRPVDLLTRRAVERSMNQQRRLSILADAVSLLCVPTTSMALGRVDA